MAKLDVLSMVVEKGEAVSLLSACLYLKNVIETTSG